MTPHHRFPRWVLLSLPVLAIFLFGGCGRNPAGRLAVSGKVQFDGMPLEKGTIDFRPVAGSNGISSGAAILDGAYHIATARGLPPGKYEVRIFSSEEDMSPPAEGVPPGAMRPAIERIPPEFNARTTQVVEVAPAGRNQFDFDVPAR